LPGFQKDIQTVKRTFVDCNSPNLVRRIEARIQLSNLVKFDPDLFGDIREVSCNLQARYFDKDKLVDIFYDRRLAETMWMLLRDFPFNWGDRPGHLVKTPENIKLVEDVANDPECYLGPPDKHGHHWYRKILKDGKQVWAKVRNNEIVAWGVNKPDNIKYYNPETGLAAPKPPGKSWKLNS